MEPQGASSEKRSRHIYFMEDNLLDVILQILQISTVLKHEIKLRTLESGNLMPLCHIQLPIEIRPGEILTRQNHEIKYPGN